MKGLVDSEPILVGGENACARFPIYKHTHYTQFTHKTTHKITHKITLGPGKTVSPSGLCSDYVFIETHLTKKMLYQYNKMKTKSTHLIFLMLELT